MTTQHWQGTAFSLIDDVGEPHPWVVLIHGLGLHKDMWQRQLPVLRAHYRLLCYDIYGHGESVPPPSAPTLALYARQLLCVLDGLEIARAAVLGFSLGGMIARKFALDYGERLTALGVLCSAYKRTDEARAAVQKRADSARAHGPEATVDEALARWFSQDFHSAHPEVIAQVRAWVIANDKEIYPQIYQLLVDGVDEICPLPAPIACPTLVMAGSRDAGNSPETAHAIAAEIPSARVEILPNLRHMAMVEAPDIVNAVLLDFLFDALAHG